MTDANMGKRANGTGGGGRNGAGSGGPPARSDGPRRTRNLCAEFRDHFDDFELACYRAPSLEGPDAAAIWERLADRLESSIRVAAKLLPVLRADIVDMKRGSKSVADDLGEKNKP